ncbi:hypothetical protein HKD37_18G051167 [Glycine soja]
MEKSLGDKVKDKIRSQSVNGDILYESFRSQSINGDIPYESLSYGQLISYVQKVALKIFQDDKIQRQLAKEKAQTRRDLGSFCEQFGLPACPKQKKKQNPIKESHGNKTLNKKRFPRRKYSHKPSTSKEADTPKPKIKPKIICYNCGKQGHISKYCRFKKKLRNLNLDPTIEEQINNLLIETSDEETKNASSASSKENLNLIQQDGQPSSTDDEDIREINTLTREQDLLFEAINYIPDPQEKKVFLEKLRKTLETKPRPKDFITNNKFDDVPSNVLRQRSQAVKPLILCEWGYKRILRRENEESKEFSDCVVLNSLTREKGDTKEFRQLVLRSFGKGRRETKKEFRRLVLGEFFLEKGEERHKKNSGGSSTQIVTIKPESSTQEPLKSSTSKQTKVDYAFSIETLQALQEMGLAKLPKLAKKTWADITSESNDDFETDLQTMIQNTKRSKTIVNPKGKQTLSQQKTPPPKPTNNKNPFKATTKAFSPGFHFKPTTTNKTRIFYKFILTNTNSVSIKHFKDLNDTNLNTHPTLQILKVLQPRQFGTNLNQSKKFSVPFDPIGYTFWDYVDARTNYGQTENNKQFPSLQRHAFIKWWNQFDTSKAAPDQVKIWFQAHPKCLKVADPETSLFLNQKSQLASFLTSSISKESLAKNLKKVLQLLQQQEDDPFYQNEDDCFGISLNDD